MGSVDVALCLSIYSSMPVLPFAHLALYLFCNSPLFQVFMEDPFLIRTFCTIQCQCYILLPFLNGFYTLLHILVRVAGATLISSEEVVFSEFIQLLSVISI